MNWPALTLLCACYMLVAVVALAVLIWQSIARRLHARRPQRPVRMIQMPVAVASWDMPPARRKRSGRSTAR